MSHAQKKSGHPYSIRPKINNSGRQHKSFIFVSQSKNKINKENTESLATIRVIKIHCLAKIQRFLAKSDKCTFNQWRLFFCVSQSYVRRRRVLFLSDRMVRQLHIQYKMENSFYISSFRTNPIKRYLDRKKVKMCQNSMIQARTNYVPLHRNFSKRMYSRCRIFSKAGNELDLS